jgi:3-hydroxybutyrate dehydrogenase
MHDAADMPMPAKIVAMTAKVESKLGSLDILINNAGIQYVARHRDQIIGVDLSAAFHTIREWAPGQESAQIGSHH